MNPIVPVVVPLLGAAAVTLLRDRTRAADCTIVACGVIQVVAVATMLPGLGDQTAATVTIAPFLPEAPIALRVDPLGVLLLLTASPLWLLTAIYSMGYLGAAGSLARFHALVAITIATTAGVAFAANLVALYLFYEVMTVVTYPLVTLTGSEEASRQGRRYLAYQLGTGIALFLPAIILTYIETGSFALTPGGIFANDVAGFLPVLIYLMFLFGIAKAAIVPAHAWLPAAMVAPVPVSALLHAVAVVNVGVFTLFRVLLDVFGIRAVAVLGLGSLTLVVTSITILVASLVALQLDNLKGILAYSTIGQLSYMLLGISLLNEAGMTGGILHLLGHAVSKITLFFAVGAIAVTTGATTLTELRGLAQRRPIIVATFAVGAASIVGLPPTIGFVTKYFLFIGSAEAQQWVILGVLAASTLLSATYYLRMVRTSMAAGALVRSEVGAVTLPAGTRRPLPVSMLAPMLVTAGATILLGLAPGPLLSLVRAAIP